MNLIQTLGADYMTEMCSGAYFFWDDRLMAFGRARNDGMSQCLDADTSATQDVPNDFFTGWAVFRSAPSGYRRLDEHVVAYCTRQNSTRRGVRPDGVRMTFTPATTQLSRLVNGSSSPLVQNSVKMREYLRPTFDNLEESLPRLLEGKQLSIVLNENLVIETAVNGRADAWYHVLNKTNLIGRLNRQGRVTWNDPEQSVLIPSLQAA